MQNGYHTAKVEWIKDETIPEEELGNYIGNPLKLQKWSTYNFSSHCQNIFWEAGHEKGKVHQLKDTLPMLCLCLLTILLPKHSVTEKENYHSYLGSKKWTGLIYLSCMYMSLKSKRTVLLYSLYSVFMNGKNLNLPVTPMTY